MDCVSGSCCYYRKQVFVLTNPLAESFFFHWVLTNSCVIHDCKSNQAMITENQPDNVGSCLSFLCKQLWVMHHLLQEANYSHLQLCVQLKVLRIHKWTTTVSLLKCYELFCCCFFYPVRAQKDRTKQEKEKRKKRGLHLRMFGDPVTQHIQDSVCGSSSDNKLFVPISLVCRETWNKKWTPVLYTINILWSFF